MTIKRVAVVTGSRAEFGLLCPVIDELQSAGHDVFVVASGMHLASEFGETLRDVERTYPVAGYVEMDAGSDDHNDRARALGRGVEGFAALFAKLDPEVVIVLGDRVEAFAAAVAAASSNRVLGHLHGGEVTRGGLDESLRHAITKLAHIHFAASAGSRDRLVRMGEEPERIHLVGAPAIDAIRRTSLMDRGVLEEVLGCTLEPPLVLMVQHPVSTRAEDADGEIRETLEALKSLNYTTICLFPNSDPGGRGTIQALSSYSNERWLHITPSLEHHVYLGVLALADVLVGNSSSGIVEAAALHTPVVNIGERQQGRERSDNFLDVAPDRKQIADAVQHAVSSQAFRQQVQATTSPYGDGSVGMQVAEILTSLRVDASLLQKQLTY